MATEPVSSTRRAESDPELRLLLRIARAIPRVRRASALVNRVIKPWYLRKRRAPVVAPFLHGLSIEVDPHEAVDAFALFAPQLYECAVLDFALGRLRPGDLFLDCGAHIGFYSLLAAQRVLPGRVIAIEADPGTFRRLRANLALNGLENVVAVNVGVSDAPGVLPFFLNAGGNRGGNSFTKGGAKSIDVACRPLAEILRQAGAGPIRYAKLDIEGMEARVLRAFFAAWPEAGWPEWIQIEDVPRQRAAGERPIGEIMAAAGYRLERTFGPDLIFHRARGGEAGA